MYDPAFTKKNGLLAQELEQCRAQLNAATAELENFKKASSGNIPLHRGMIIVYNCTNIVADCIIGSPDQLEEKLKIAQEGEREAKRLHATGERVLTRVRDEKN